MRCRTRRRSSPPRPPSEEEDETAPAEPAPEPGDGHAVAVERLSFRSAPKIDAPSLIGSLYYAHPVEVLGQDQNPKWSRIRAMFEGGEQEGFAWSAFLRPQASPSKEALLRAAVEQWLRFNRGAGKE